MFFFPSYLLVISLSVRTRYIRHRYLLVCPVCCPYFVLFLIVRYCFLLLSEATLFTSAFGFNKYKQ